MTMANIGLTVPPAIESLRGHGGSTVNAMRWLKRGVLATVIAVLAVAAFTGWYVYGAWPVPDGYTFPRHSIWGSGPAALFEGTLLIEDGCIRTA
jgi:hypothetical protein